MKEIVLIPIPIEEFENRIGSLLDKKLSEVRGINPSKQLQDEYLTRKETAKLLRISLGTLLQYTKDGDLTGYRIGNRVLYKKSEVECKLEAIKYSKYKKG